MSDFQMNDRDMEALAERIRQLEAQRDRTEELLRQAMSGLERGGASEVLGRIDAYFAYHKRENCQRCGDEGIVNRGSATWERPCPDCAGGAS